MNNQEQALLDRIRALMVEHDMAAKALAAVLRENAELRQQLAKLQTKEREAGR